MGYNFGENPLKDSCGFLLVSLHFRPKYKALFYFQEHSGIIQQKEAHMKKLIKLLTQKEIILYIVFGLLTTLVDMAVFDIWFNHFGKETANIGNAVSFITATVFAYFTNKLFVFETRSWSPEVLKKEIPVFFSGRIFSFIISVVGMAIATNIFNTNDKVVFGLEATKVVKFFLTILVVSLNYIFSKFWAFKKND